MFNFLSSFWTFLFKFWSSKIVKNDLSLEDASNILEEKLTVCQQTCEETKNVSNNFCNKTGVITKHEENVCFIDDLYTFCSETANFPVGAKVSYDVLISDSNVKVININLIDSDWDVLQTNSSLWNTRIIICKVENQINRTLIASPGDITIDMNSVSMDFLPVVGDWIELEAKCSINENVIDLAGQLIEINKVSPVRAHIAKGIVTAWDLVKEIGIVNRNVFVNKYSLACGYVPKVRDKVIVEIIESQQEECSWRALKVIPENIRKELDSINKSNNLPEFLNEYPGVQINIPILNFNKLNEQKSFEVTVSNVGDECLELIDVEFIDDNSQCKVLCKDGMNMKLSSNTTHNIACECTPKNIGASNSLLLFSFKNFKIGQWVTINVNIQFSQPTKYVKGFSEFSLQQTSNNELIKGRRISAPPRFMSKHIPLYAVPKKVDNVIFKYNFNDITELTLELKTVMSPMFTNLSFFNFEDKFHSLLYLEEVTNLKMISNYDQDKACFIPSDDYLLLEIENLSERRPSIVLGDKVIAFDPLSRNGLDFEGFIHKVGAKHIFIKFSQLFHEQYKGEDYSIKIVPSRSSFRRLHHAIFLAPRTLGKEILFPSKVHEKDLQVEFVEDDFIHQNNSVLNSSTSSKKLSQLELLKKLKEINNKNSNNNQDQDNKLLEEKCKLKLEWYNKKLNVKQKDAVRHVLMGRARPLPYIIFGPPGTGKTVTIIEMVLQIIRLIPHSRLLICAPSNSASDLIAIQLIDSGVIKPGDLVRLVSYNYAVSDNIPVKLVPYCATASLARDGTTENKISSGIQYDLSHAALGRHRITVSTCSLAGQLYYVAFPKGHFSHIVVDEAGQASEPEVLIPLTFLDKFSGQIILAGDPLQLGPVVLSNLVAECGLSESYLERLINRFPYVIDPHGFPDTSGYDPRLVTKLLHNYRSLPSILKLTSLLFYNNELIPTIDNEVSEEANFVDKLSDILPKTILGNVPRLVFHGVNGENYQSSDSPSWYNPHEAAQVFYYVNELYRLRVDSSHIGIITPYIKQVKEIRSLLLEAEFNVPKIGTVEEFQGQEFPVIILSTVRSSQQFVSVDVQHSLGFITSPRRVNVAISRAKSLLIVIGNPNLLSVDTYWRSVLKYCLENGSYTGCDFVH